MSRKKELLDIPPDEPEMMHSILSKLPKPLDLDGLITGTCTLFHRYPPPRLPNRAWTRVSKYSVLKTTRDAKSLSRQTLADGERLFQLQAKELHNEEARKRMRIRMQALATRYRRPAAWAGGAMIIALISI